jgi:23S rRNA pseudouridine2605 synthase
MPAVRDDNGERIAKVMARAGLCSRRDAETWIAAGRVEVNGIRLRSPALNVRPSDSIVVDGRPLAERERTRLFLFHKPRGLVTTDRDPQDRPTIFSVLPRELPRVVTIGRLDINTEGLLLLTNDGGLARVLELPATGWVRRYRVRANGTTDQAALDALREGITIDGIHYAGIVASLDRVQGANVWLTMALREGKNHEVKRVLEHLGLAVNRLIRISFGPFQLGELAESMVEEVKTRVLRDQLGMNLAKEAGVDFVGPVVAPIVTVEENERRRAARSEAQSFGERSRPAPSRHSSGRDKGADAPRRRDYDRPGRGGAEVEQSPRRDRPKPGTRKHVSALRRERMETEAQKATPRRRIERAETADRKGRAVTVERIVVPVPGEKSSRNGRRFAEWKGRAPDHRSSDGKPPAGKRGKGAPRDRPRGPKPAGGRPRGKI